MRKQLDVFYIPEEVSGALREASPRGKNAGGVSCRGAGNSILIRGEEVEVTDKSEAINF